MTTIADEVQRFPGVRALPGMDRAWTFPGARNRFQRAIALGSDDGHAFQILCSNGYSDEAAREILDFARANEPTLLKMTPFAVATGFRLPGKDFDCVASVLPSVTGSHAQAWEATVYDVFPAWACEFSGDETEIEAQARFTRMLEPKNYERRSQPFVRMRYENANSGLRASKSGNRMLADAARLEREIRVADQVGDGWVEAENFRGLVRRIEWHEGAAELVDLESKERSRFRIETTPGFVQRFLEQGSD